MQSIRIPYGKRYLSATLDEGINVNIIDPKIKKLSYSLERLLIDSFDNPRGPERIENLVRYNTKITIIVNDHTRPGPTSLIVEELIRRLSESGVNRKNIKFVVATGSHRASTENELNDIIGPKFRKDFTVHIHDCLKREEIVFMGESSVGIPIFLNRHVAESDFIITTGLISPHHSAGYSGGRKSIFPGVAGFESIKQHHSLPYRPSEPAMGFIEGNPFHEISLEAARMVKVKFIINAVQNPLKENIAFVSGDLEKAHKEGVDICRKACEVKFDTAADVVITSPGGYPRDINLYQAQKALSVAEPLGKPGCTYILVAEAPDGIGEGVLKEWMTEADTPQDVISRFKKEGFDIGSNKAFMFARALTKGRVIIVSDKLKKEDLSQMMLESTTDLQTAIKMAKSDTIIKNIVVLPNAVNIIPKLRVSQ